MSLQCLIINKSCKNYFNLIIAAITKVNLQFIQLNIRVWVILLLLVKD